VLSYGSFNLPFLSGHSLLAFGYFGGGFVEEGFGGVGFVVSYCFGFKFVVFVFLQLCLPNQHHIFLDFHIPLLFWLHFNSIDGLYQLLRFLRLLFS
jgi:hypothetical protein